MPKYIKHYKQKQNIVKFQEKKQRKGRLQAYLINKKKKPETAMYVNLKTRDKLNGRAKAHYAFFGLSRHSLKRTFGKSGLPGIILSSW